MTTSIHDMLKLIGGGGTGWQTQAAETLGLSRGTVRNALNNDVSDKTVRKIKATYAAMSRHAVPADADKSAGSWAVGMPIKKTTDKSIMDQCVVTHMSEPTFSAHIILRSGKTMPGAGGERIVETRITTVSGEKRGLGDLVEKAREIGVEYMKKAQFDRLEMDYRADVEARAVAAKWGSAQEARGAAVAELVDAYDVLTDDDVRAAHDMIAAMQAEALAHRRAFGAFSGREAEAFEVGRQAGEIGARAMLLSELLSEIVARRDRAEVIPGARVIRRAVADMTPVQRVYPEAVERAERAEEVRLAKLQERHDRERQRLSDAAEMNRVATVASASKA